MNNKHIKKILYNSLYNINENVKFNKIDSSYFENDDVANFIDEDEENDKEISNNMDDDLENKNQNIDVSGKDEVKKNDTDKNVDLIQNKIIKNTINTMNMIHNKMKELDDNIKKLEYKYLNLKKDVDEVKEPTNKEKLMQHHNDSRPYYKNLNDVWRKDDMGDSINDDGIIKLPNGKYIAIFDNLGNMSSVDLNKSFYQYE